MSTFRLSAAEVEQVAGLEKDSFLAHCRQFGLDPARTTNHWYETYMAKVRADMAYAAALTRNRPAVEALFRPLLECKDYWELMHWTTVERRRQLTTMICRSLRTLEIDDEYCAQLCSAIGLPGFDRDDAVVVADLISAVPTINSYSMNFNAYVTDRTLIRGVPCVYLFTCVPQMIEYFLDLFLLAFTQGSGTRDFDLRDVAEMRELGRREDFKMACWSGFLALLRATTRVTHYEGFSFRARFPGLVAEYLQALQGASWFIWFHEYGHLLNGHLVKTHSHQLELDADRFAARVVLGSAAEERLRSWGVVGMAVFFSVMEILVRLHPPAGSSHPTPTARLLALQPCVGTYPVQEVGERLRAFWSSPLDEFIALGSASG